MFLAPLAILFDFHSARIVAAILLGCVVSLFAIIARKGDDGANIFFLRGHAYPMQSNELTDAPYT